MATRDEGTDPGRGGRVEVFETNDRGRPARGAGPGPPAPGPTPGEPRDFGPITNPIILERKKLIDKLTSEMLGMIMVDKPLPEVAVDLNRMMYLYPKGPDDR